MKYKMGRCCSVIFILAYVSVCCCHDRTLTEIISRYETLNRGDFRHRVVRRSVPSGDHKREIDFVSHGENFHMKLVPSREIFDPSFRVVSVDRYGKKTPVYINKDYFYKGYVENEPSSHVIAHVEDDGLITATVSTANDTYVVEPMWRHVEGNASHDHIVYKASDVKWNLTHPGSKKNKALLNTCGNSEVDTEGDDDTASSKRVRRNVPCNGKHNGNGTKNTCKLHLVADYNFCLNVGRKDSRTTALYMLQVINVVNDIYLKTCWDGVGTGIGVQVKGVDVHCDGYTSTPTYNQPVAFNVDSMLTAFSLSDWSGVCLAHLFTYQDFSEGVIGLAYVANKNSRFGGICSPKARDSQGRIRHYNSGYTSHINWGRRLTTVEANLVTAHEIGHNFGSKHDNPSDTTCSPDDGKYIMFASSVTGENAKNHIFSPCSKALIGGVLEARKNRCLQPRGGAVCKNGIVEAKDGEECDEGQNPNDPCCKDCKFKDAATCSDKNHACCRNCQSPPADGTVCRGNFTLGCEGAITCNGVDKTCPSDAPKLTSGEPCVNVSNLRKGICDKRGCVSICGNNRKSCSCQGANACKVCCRPAAGGKCQPYTPAVNEVDGVQCKHADGETGLCESGVCSKLKTDVKESFKNLLLDFSFDKAVKFMRNNIVISILFFSLLIWIPAGLIVNAIDRREERKYKELVEEEDAFSRGSKQRESLKKNKGKDQASISRSGAS